MSDTKKRILVVDDEESQTRLLKVCLEKTGRFVVEVENVPTRALETANRFGPDLILLDIMMPELDGGLLSSQFKEDARLKHVPIVFLTALVRKSEEGMIGGSPFLSKPVMIPEVIDCLDKQLAA